MFGGVFRDKARVIARWLRRGIRSLAAVVTEFVEDVFRAAGYTSAMYSELPPAEKETWVQRAEADKARYLHELANYVAPPGYDPKGDAIVSSLQKSGRKGKPEKDPNAPKRNMSAFFLYSNANRARVKAENPTAKFGDIVSPR